LSGVFETCRGCREQQFLGLYSSARQASQQDLGRMGLSAKKLWVDSVSVKESWSKAE
jgi:hypothetical protein